FSQPPPPPANHTLPLHDGLPISAIMANAPKGAAEMAVAPFTQTKGCITSAATAVQKRVTSSVGSFPQPMPKMPFPPLVTLARMRTQEHTSELQSLRHLVCRLLLE